MNIHIRFLGVLLMFSLLSCEQNVQKEADLPAITHAKELIERSIAYHDPNGNWKNFESSIQIQSTIRKEGGEANARTTELFFDNRKGEFRMHVQSDEIEYKGEVSRDTCYNQATKEPSPELAPKYQSILNCDGVKFYKDYYSYLIGLPMKLLDKEAIVQDSLLERTHDEVAYDVVRVNYEPIGKSPVWYFYFDKKSHAMELAKFTSAESEDVGGEYIIYNQAKSIQSMILTDQLLWLYNRPGLDTLAIENLRFINN